MRRHSLRLLLNISLLSGLFASAITQMNGRTLDKRSPFLPPSFFTVATTPKTIKKAAPDTSRFILRGISKIGDTYLFSIYDKKMQKAKWVEAGVSSNGFSITSYDPCTRTISYRWNGQEVSLQLINANNTALPLEYLSDAENQLAASSGHTVATPDSPSSSKSVANLTRSMPPAPASRLQESLKRVYFNNTQYQCVPSGRIGTDSPASILGSPDDTFASTDLPADAPPEGSPSVGGDQSHEAPTRFKVSRKNSVNNANGKKPDHMSYANWMALKKSQQNR